MSRDEPRSNDRILGVRRIRLSVASLLRDSYRRWHGVLLCVSALVSTVWLAITNQLILYIHPRYVVFSVIMAVLGLFFVVASFVRAKSRHSDHDDADPPGHETTDNQPADAAPRSVRRLISIGASILTLAVAGALVVIPPTTLTTATAEQRGINSTTVGANAQSVDSAASAPQGASAKFSVLEWSSLLRETNDAGFFRNKPANIVGFITRDRDDPQNMFYVSRFVITCCAVDAQPVGVPVYLRNWQTSFSADDWVLVSGELGTNPSDKSPSSIALMPLHVKKVNQPSEPYLY